MRGCGAAVAAAFLFFGAVTPAAHAAFELRDAHPGALGAASPDGMADLLFGDGSRGLGRAGAPDPDREARPGLYLGASRASLFEVEGLTMSQLVLAADRPTIGLAAAWSVLAAPGARESTARVSVEERARSAVSLSGMLERLDMWVDDEPRWGGWALGGRVRAEFPAGGLRARVGFQGNRLVRSAALDRARVDPSLAVGLALGVGGSTVAFLDRRESSGSQSPRWIVELPLADFAAVRFARGAEAGRIGVSLSVRVGRMEFSVGRLDYASGSSISSGMVGLRRGSTTRVPLLAPRPSATMRWKEGIGQVGPAPGVALADSAAPGGDAAATTPSAPAPDQARDPAPQWLPEAADDADLPDSAEAATKAAHGFLMRGNVSAGTFRIRRVAVARERGGTRFEISFLQARERWSPALAFAARQGSCRGAIGRIAAGGFAPLFGEAMGLATATRNVRPPAWGPPSMGPALGESPATIEGAAVALRGVSRTALPPGPAGSWAVVGRQVEGGSVLGAAGVGWRGRRAALAAALGSRRQGRGTQERSENGRTFAASLTGMRRGVETEVSGEVLVRGDSWAGLIGVERRRGPIHLGGRWRYYSWMARRVAAEVSAQAGGPSVRARVTWRSWASGTAYDNGRIEIDAAAARGGLGPLRIRLGAEGVGRDLSYLWSGARYGIADWTVASDGSRSFALLASRREATRRARPSVRAAPAEAGSAFATAAGTTLGARLGLDAGRRGEHAVVFEATRISRGGMGAAWGSDVYPSGAAILRMRSRPGVWITARGTVGLGIVRLGYTLSRVEDEAGAKPLSGTVWIWVGRSEASRAGSAAPGSHP